MGGDMGWGWGWPGWGPQTVKQLVPTILPEMSGTSFSYSIQSSLLLVTRAMIYLLLLSTAVRTHKQTIASTVCSTLFQVQNVGIPKRAPTLNPQLWFARLLALSPSRMLAFSDGPAAGGQRGRAISDDLRTNKCPGTSSPMIHRTHRLPWLRSR